MPSAIPTTNDTITKFTNCLLVKGDELVSEDLWVSSRTGKIVRSQEAFYSTHTIPTKTIDLGGRILSPGLIDVQLNGAFGFNFSSIPSDPSSYGKQLRQVNKSLIQTGVTSYLPTLTSSPTEVYHQALPFLGPSGGSRIASDGAESLGAHCEGPFLNPSKNGIHPLEHLVTATSLSDLETVYGSSNLYPTTSSSGTLLPAKIRKLTVAPECGAMSTLIPSLVSNNTIISLGHTAATYEEASFAISQGASMITHLFNAMAPLHHRNPGVFGVLGQNETETQTKHEDGNVNGTRNEKTKTKRPFFGIIADGIHLHPTSITIAHAAHPQGFILVSDAMHLVGLPDGLYPWSHHPSSSSSSSTSSSTSHGPSTPQNLQKIGSKLVLEGTDTIAGSSITLLECVNNFLTFSGASIPIALRAVTQTPAKMLGLGGVKGGLWGGCDADLCVFSLVGEGGERRLVVDMVWKFGVCVFEREGGGGGSC